MTDTPEFLKDIASKATAVKVRNVMNPLLWLNAVVVPAALAAVIALQAHLILSIPILIVGLLVPIWTLNSYSGFAKRDPQRLQSEEFLIEQQRMLLQSKGSPQLIDISSAPVSANPELNLLGQQSEGNAND